MVYLQTEVVSCVIIGDAKHQFKPFKPLIAHCSLLIAHCFLLLSSSAIAAEPQKITVKHVTSYTIKSMGGVVPSTLYFDRHQNELYVGSQDKELVIINEDGIVVQRISLID